MPTLPVSRLINVSVQLTPNAAQAQNLSTLLVLGTSAIIDSVERWRPYETLADVAADFGATAEEYKAALLWFQQAPQPTQLRIGRWFNAASKGGLRCATIPASSQLLSAWTGITNGGFTYTKDGGPATNVTGINFSSAANLNAVATLIQNALTGVAVVWNANYQRFEFTSNTTGATSSISFLSAPSAGTDISAQLGGRSTDSGAYLFVGMAAETALDAATLFDANYGQSWYAMTIPAAVNNDHLAVAAYLEGTNAKHLYGVTTMEAGALVPSSTTDLAYLLNQQNLLRTVVQYSSVNAQAVVSLLARALTVDYTGNNTVITLMYKQEPGIVAESINSTQALALETKACNVFVNYNNDTAIIQRGVVSKGEFLDVVTGTDWLAVTLQNSLYNLLYTSTTKVPQTDAGVALLTTTCAAVCGQAVLNGLLAPGQWNSGGFGELRQGDFMAKGYYIYAPPVRTQNPADRAARKSVPIQVAAKLAGAIHDINVAVTVNQ